MVINCKDLGTGDFWEQGSGFQLQFAPLDLQVKALPGRPKGAVTHFVSCLGVSMTLG